MTENLIALIIICGMIVVLSAFFLVFSIQELKARKQKSLDLSSTKDRDPLITYKVVNYESAKPKEENGSLKKVSVFSHLFSNPWDRVKEYPILPGELCILCLDDKNKEKNRYAIVREVNPDPNSIVIDADFTIHLFDDNEEMTVKQKDLLFIPWIEESKSDYFEFLQNNEELIIWVIKKRLEKIKNED